MKPSRTYNIAIFGMVCQLVLVAATTGIAIWAPEALSAASEVLALVAMGLGGGSAAGCGAMAARDYGSGGLTSSQSADVLSAQGE